MTSYHSSNIEHNFQKLFALFAITFINFLTNVISIPISYVTLLLVLANILVGIFLIKLYRKKSFTLQFKEEAVIQKFTFSNTTNIYSYKDLLSVELKDFQRGPSDNIFIFQKNGVKYKFKCDEIASGEAYVQFIKWLKTKNGNFETYIYPKGTTLHMRLRQEILGKEY